jgi:hypothetical protein
MGTTSDGRAAPSVARIGGIPPITGLPRPFSQRKSPRLFYIHTLCLNSCPARLSFLRRSGNDREGSGSRVNALFGNIYPSLY